MGQQVWDQIFFYMPHNAVVDAREAGLLFELPERDKKSFYGNHARIFL